MKFFDQAKIELDSVIEGLQSDRSDNMKQRANDAADSVLAAAKQMGGSIPGDINDTLMTKAKEIKQELASLEHYI